LIYEEQRRLKTYLFIPKSPLMKQHPPKVTGLAILALLIQTSVFAQEDSNQDRDEGSTRKYDEIVIRHKSGKDAKVTIEIKDGDVLVDGKPVSEYEDSTLTIHRRKIMHYGNGFDLASPEIVPDGNVFPNQGAGWSFSGDNVFKSNRAMLGVASVTSVNGKGAKVSQVTKGSAAEKMGLKAGDVITKIDDREITDPSSLYNVIGGHDPGDKVTVTYMRDGKEQKATGELDKGKSITMEPLNIYKYEMPEAPEAPEMPAMPEMRVMPQMPHGTWQKEFHEFYGNSLKFGIRAQDAEDGKGVKVLDVDDESTAAKAGIKEGDVITRFDGKDINSVTALTEAAHAAKDKISVKVTIIRDGKAQEIEVKVPRRLRTADL
jgi:serine protease Do